VAHSADQFTSEARAQLGSNEWVKTFRGRDILRRFVGQHGQGLRYEPFRDLIIARMRDADHKPAGMKAVVDQILNDVWTSGRQTTRSGDR